MNATGGTENRAVSAHSNGIAAISNAVSHNGALHAGGSGRNVLITFTPGIYTAGESDGKNLVASGNGISDIEHIWAKENGMYGIMVSKDVGSIQNTFLPIANGVTVSAPLDSNNASITINRGTNSNVSMAGKTFYAYKIFD